jgi:hypothetical protein
MLFCFKFLLMLSTVLAQAPSKSGDAVVFGASGTYPRATFLMDGSMLGTYTHFEGGFTSLFTVRSTDNGVSWSVIGSIATEITATKDLDNPFVHQMPNGDVLAAFRNHDRDSADSPITWHRITVCISKDMGQTWNYLSTPIEMPAGPGIWEPFMQTGLDNGIQLYYSKETSDGQDSIIRHTYDNGSTWTEEQTFTGQGTNARDGMIGVVSIADNSPDKVAIFESGDVNISPTHFTVWSVRSTDDGKTWGSQRYPIFTPSTSQAGAPQIIRVGTRLVASFGTNESGGDWPVGAMAVMISSDGGYTWGDKTIVRDEPAMWSSMITLDDTSFLALYESGGTSFSQRMVFN